jgi:hypothetical protein
VFPSQRIYDDDTAFVACARQQRVRLAEVIPAERGLLRLEAVGTVADVTSTMEIRDARKRVGEVIAAAATLATHKSAVPSRES